MFLFDLWIIWRKKAYSFGLDPRVNTTSCEKALWLGEKCRMVLSNWFGSARQRLKGMTSKTVDFRYVLLEYSDVFAQRDCLHQIVLVKQEIERFMRVLSIN